MSVTVQKIVTETRPADVDLTKTQPCKYFVQMERGNPSQEWTKEKAIYSDTFLL